jgi:quercetin dioxygenase-like cupin family protein
MRVHATCCFGAAFMLGTFALAEPPATTSGAHPAATSDSHPAVMIDQPEKAQFQSVPGVPACNTMVGTRGDPSKEPATFLVKMTSGCVVPWHWHRATEEVILLKGTAVAQMKAEKPIVLKAASYSQLPVKHVHRFRCSSKEACYVFVVADAPFDINYVDATGKEITPAEAIAEVERDGHRGW